MPYTPHQWQNDTVAAPYGPVSAARLTEIENALVGPANMVFNVKDPAYGAVGDGVANDTAALDAATAAASAAGGGMVAFPKGTYKYNSTSQLQVPAGVVFEGQGNATIVLVGTANGYIWLSNAGGAVRDIKIRRGNATVSYLLNCTAANCEVRNVYFDSQGATYTGAALTIGTNATGVLVFGNTFANTNGYGITCIGGSYIRILSNRFSGSLGALGVVDFNANSADILDFVISDNVILTDSTQTGGAIGAHTSAAGKNIARGVIADNQIECGGSGIGVVLTAGGNRPSTVAITGNSIRNLNAGSGQSGVTLSQADNCTVVGNTIDCNGLVLDQGIELVLANYCNVTGNTILGTTGVVNGIYVNTCVSCAVVGNTIREFKDAASSNSVGIVVNNPQTGNLCTDNTITSNTILFPIAAAGSLEYGIKLSAGASGAVSRNVISGNTIRGNNVTNSRCITLDNFGTMDANIVTNNNLSNTLINLQRLGDTNSVVRHNRGWITENNGVASKQNGSTIAHGLAATPTKATLTPSVAKRLASVTGLDGTNITISLHDDTGAAIAVNENVYWTAEV